MKISEFIKNERSFLHIYTLAPVLSKSKHSRLKRSPGCFHWRVREPTDQWHIERSRREMKSLRKTLNLKGNECKMPDMEWRMTKERGVHQQRSRLNEGLSTLYSGLHHCSGGETSRYAEAAPLPPSSYNLTTTAHPRATHCRVLQPRMQRSKREAQCTSHCPSLSTPRDYKHPAKKNIQKLACLVLCIEYSITAINGCQREVCSQQTCQHPAASLAEHNGREIHVFFHM